MNEAPNLARIRLHYANLGWRLFRNNSGVLLDKTGRPVRFGLGNESRQLNDQIKSGDAIGWAPTLITPDMVGDVIARFVSIEAKRDGWAYRSNDPATRAQERWANMIRNDGGIAGFMIDPERGFER